MEQMGGEVKQTGSGEKAHAFSLPFYIILPEKPVHVYSTAQERAFLFCEQRAEGTCLHVHLAVLCAGSTRLAPTEVERRPAARVKYPDACIDTSVLYR